MAQNFIYKLRDLAFATWPKSLGGVVSFKQAQTIELKLTSADSRKFSQGIMDMMNESFVVDTGVKVETEKFHFTTVMLPQMLQFKVVNEGSSKSTMTYGGKTICIDTH